MMRCMILGWMLCAVSSGAVVDKVVHFAAEPFALKEVSLLDGPFKHAQAHASFVPVGRQG